MLYPEALPELKTSQRLCYLSPGAERAGEGSIAFLFSKTFEDSLSMIQKRSNFYDSGNRYKYFYCENLYVGKVGTKRYHIRNTKERKRMNDVIAKQTMLTPILTQTVEKTFRKNLYVDLSTHLAIFDRLSESLPPTRQIQLFWPYLKSILSHPQWEANYPRRVLLFPISEKISFSGNLKTLVRNPICLCYYTLYKYPELLSDVDIDILFYSGKRCLKWNPSHSDKKTASVFKAQMKLLLQNVKSLETAFDDEVIDQETKEDELVSALDQRYNFVGDHEEVTSLAKDAKAPADEKKQEVMQDNAAEKKKQEKIEATVKQVMTQTSDPEEIKDKVEDELSQDKEFIEDMYKAAMKEVLPKSTFSSARDQKIREEQKNVQFLDMTIGDLERIKANNVKIPTRDVGKVLQTTNKNFQQVKFTNFERVYNETLRNKDIAGVFTSLNDKSLPMYVISMDVQDTSDELNYKETWKVVLEDTKRTRHTITVDIPKFIDDKFMYLGGNKKLILKQNFFYPVVKIREGIVHIVTNENKMILERVENRTISSVTRLTKLIDVVPDALKFFQTGNAFVLNGESITTVEYDELSKAFLSFKTPKCEIFFSQPDAETYANSHDIRLDKHPNELFIGHENGKPVFIDYDTQMTAAGEQIIEIIARNLPDDMQGEFRNIRMPKRMMYAKVTTMKKDIPVGLLLGYWEGIQKLMEKADIEYRLSEKYPSDLLSNEGILRFSDCYLIYKEDVPKQLLMNGFRIVDTTKYKLIDYNTHDPYLEYFTKVYGKMSIGNALMNTKEFTIDNITKEILETLMLPTDITDLIIYAVKLMADSRYKLETDQTISRVRSNEIVAGILYDAIAKQYTTYRNSNGKNKLSIQRDIVIKNLLGLKTVEDSSTLNPVLELERTHTVMQKGWRGINLDDAYTINKRAYDKSMIGVIGPTTSPDASVGVQRVLSMEPRIDSVRGFTKQTDANEYNTLKDVNVFSPGEMLIPISTTRDDSTRMGHAIKQSKHVVPTKHSSPVLISNGAEEACRFDLSTDFVINAEEDGEIVEYDDKVKIMICRYKSGKCQAIDMNPKIVKNGGGGFYLSNILTTDYKVGDKFKKNELLAYHKDFFTSNQNGQRMNFGNLVKVALTSTYNTYEDSSFITHKLSKEAETEMVFNKQVVVGKNATVDYMVQIGDHIEIGDTLIQFDTSFEDDELNKMLRTISDELQEGILEDSRNDIKSKRAGVIEDIKIYSSVELEELSPSLQKIVGDYYKTIKKKKALLEKYDPDGSIVKCGILFNQATKKITPNKYGVILGQKVEDSVLIEFYIKHAEVMEVGSKMAYYTGIKTVIGEILPEGYEPYSEFRPDEEISTTIATNSILARMTPSITLVALGNKCIIELKRALKNIYDSTKDDSSRKTQMTTLIYKFFSAFDKSGTNMEKYKNLFEPMSTQQFSTYFKRLFADEKAYLVLDIVDYEHTIFMEDIERAAKVLKIPLFEYVYMPHITMDKNNIIRTVERVPVGYVHVKRTQQTVAKKNGISTSIDIRSAMTGQVTGADKNGRESDLENIMLASLGMQKTLKELNGPRADDLTMKRQMLTEIAEKGYVQLSELDDDVSNKTTLNTANIYLLGMGLNSDLVTKGLMLKSTIQNEL